MKLQNIVLCFAILLTTACSTSISPSPTSDLGAIQTTVASSYTVTAAAVTPTLTRSPTLTLTPTLVLPVAVGTPFPPTNAAISTHNITQVLSLARWGRGSVSKAIYSRDGSSLAIATSIGVYIYDTKTR